MPNKKCQSQGPRVLLCDQYVQSIRCAGSEDGDVFVGVGKCGQVYQGWGEEEWGENPIIIYFMAYGLKLSETEIDNKEFVNEKGRTECVELVKQATGAPQTAKWVKGVNVMESALGSIRKGTGIATFTDSGYKGHAAIYVSHAKDRGIMVYDQWVDKETGNKPTASRLIRCRKLNPSGTLQNVAENYFVIE